MAPPNIVIFGKTGGGKSSIINLLAGANVAVTSNDVFGCTFNSNAYDISINGMMFRFHDTAGLDQGPVGTVGTQQAIVQLYELLRSLNDGVSLLIFCIRGPKFRDSYACNWQLVWDIICQRRVPILLAITGMENEENVDAWWEKNQTFFIEYLMYPNSVACITATRGRQRRDGSHSFEYEYEESRGKMMKAVQTVYRRDPWKIERPEWFKTIVETKTNRTVFGSATNELIERNLMKREEAEELARLLHDK